MLGIFAAAYVAFGPGGVSACKLPVSVPERVGRAQTFTYDATQAEYDAYQTKRDFIWSDTGAKTSRATPRFMPGVYSSIYTAVHRVPAHGHGPDYNKVAGWPLSWFTRHHPDWVVYKCDRVTPAYEYDDPTFIPVDIANPAVRQWRLDNEIRPLLSVGYAGISVDNIEDDNPFGYCGTFSGPGGSWVQRYTGKRYGDPEFAADQITWLSELSTYVHGNGDGCVTGNITFQPKSIATMRRFAEAVDIVFDEGSFNGGNPSCEVGGGSKYRLYGENWVAKFRFYADLGRPFVLGSNGLCSTEKARSRAVIDWALASYLLTKNDHTYIGWFERDVARFEDLPDFYLHHGPARGAAAISGSIFKRAFASILALLNPSVNQPASYDLGDSRYRDLDGVEYRGNLTLAPKTAKVLVLAK